MKLLPLENKFFMKIYLIQIFSINLINFFILKQDLLSHGLLEKICHLKVVTNDPKPLPMYNFLHVYKQISSIFFNYQNQSQQNVGTEMSYTRGKKRPKNQHRVNIFCNSKGEKAIQNQREMEKTNADPNVKRIEVGI